MRGWLGMLRNLNTSLLAVWRAELSALVDDLSSSGRRLRSALLLLALAGSLFVLLIGTLVFTAIAALAVVMPLWGAALTVAGVLALAVAIVAGLGMARLKTVESPTSTVRRRVDDHLEWWNRRLSSGRREIVGEDEYEEESE
jgi:putative superfamily III holin-X